MAAEFPRLPFLLPIQDVFKALESDPDRGLSSVQVAQLREKYPPNELDVGGAIPWYTIFLRQLFNAMIIVSSLATGLQLLPAELTDPPRSCSLPWP